MLLNSVIELSIKVLKTLTNKDNSFVYSPLSVSNFLAIMLAGSDGITASELANVIGEGFSREAIIEFYSGLLKYCKAMNENEMDDTFKLLFSNAMFLSDGDLVPTFVNVLTNFETKYFHIDFNNKKLLAEKLNQFVSENTMGQISNAISENELRSDANLYFINTLYYMGKWEAILHELSDCFYPTPSTKRQAIYLTRLSENQKWNFNEGDTWSCLGVPYKGRNSWFHILLPKKKDGLNELIQKLDVDLLKQCIAENDSGDILARFPIFKMENKFYLEETLQKMGIIEMFEHGYGINKILFNRKEYVSKVIHCTKINVDKDGTIASSALIAELVPVMYVPKVYKTFHASHPFIYFITLVENGNPEALKSILLMGKYSPFPFITDPKTKGHPMIDHMPDKSERIFTSKKSKENLLKSDVTSSNIKLDVWSTQMIKLSIKIF